MSINIRLSINISIVNRNTNQLGYTLPVYLTQTFRVDSVSAVCEIENKYF